MISTKVKTITCRCGSEIIYAVADGLPARVDPTPLTLANELAALLDGRWTYALRAGELVHRDQWVIRAGIVGTSLHAEHRCPPRYTQPRIGAA
jgi:hypothetical protein